MLQTGAGTRRAAGSTGAALGSQISKRFGKTGNPCYNCSYDRKPLDREGKQVDCGIHDE
jgi:hypothetical protein